jgi:hypothetical protein
MPRLALPAVTLLVAIFVGIAASEAQTDTAIAGGLTAYLGVVPAEIVKGHPSSHSEGTMHDGVPRGAHEYHFVVALFDTASGARIFDASVKARISGLGLSGSEKVLEPMAIADTTTYGGFFELPGADLYTVRVTIKRPSSQELIVLEFRYDHRDR